MQFIHTYYGVATISRLLNMICLFCKKALLKRLYSAKEPYTFKSPTNRSHPIFANIHAFDTIYIVCLNTCRMHVYIYLYIYTNTCTHIYTHNNMWVIPQHMPPYSLYAFDLFMLSLMCTAALYRVCSTGLR